MCIVTTNRGFSNNIYNEPTTSELYVDGESNQVHYEQIEAPDTSNEGLVNSAEAVKDGKKTTV